VTADQTALVTLAYAQVEAVLRVVTALYCAVAAVAVMWGATVLVVLYEVRRAPRRGRKGT